MIRAVVLGGGGVRASEPEIGWFPVGLTEHGCDEPLFALWPATFKAGHWHNDTFELPEGISPVMSSNLTPNQVFVYGDRVVGMQFHLEWTPEALTELADNFDDELPTGLYVQDTASMIADAPLYMPVATTLLFELLDGLAAKAGGIDS
jgi:GMP synthase (glutamine-hydrolysing)